MELQPGINAFLEQDSLFPQTDKRILLSSSLKINAFFTEDSLRLINAFFTEVPQFFSQDKRVKITGEAKTKFKI